MAPTEEKRYKLLFLDALEPFMDFLEDQQGEMTSGNWMEVVQRTQVRITINPEQYLGKELPPSEILIKIVNEIFDDFINEHVKEPEEAMFLY